MGRFGGYSDGSNGVWVPTWLLSDHAKARDIVSAFILTFMRSRYSSLPVFGPDRRKARTTYSWAEKEKKWMRHLPGDDPFFPSEWAEMTLNDGGLECQDDACDIMIGEMSIYPTANFANKGGDWHLEIRATGEYCRVILRMSQAFVDRLQNSQLVAHRPNEMSALLLESFEAKA